MKRESALKSSLLKVIYQFVNEIGVKATKRSIRTIIDNNPDSLNLSTISEVLDTFKIDSVAIRINKEELTKIPLPAIAYVRNDESLNHFVIVKKIDDDTTSYYDAERGKVTEKLNMFLDGWSGIVLVASITPESGDVNYKQNKSYEFFSTLKKWLPAFAVALLLFWSTKYSLSINVIILIYTALIGVILSILLLWEEYGTNHTLIDKICKVNDRSNCQSVLESPASKLFGLVGFAEVGFVYFITQFLILSFSGFISHQQEHLPWIAALSILALPYTIFSIYYQARVIKMWCPLCVAVQVILWIQACAAFVYLQKVFILTTLDITLIILCFALPTSLWTIAKPLFLIAGKVPKLERDLTRFRENTDLFQTLLHEEPEEEMNIRYNEIMLGDKHAPVTMTMISGPFCSPCSAAHKVVEELLIHNSRILRVVIRFAIDAENSNDERYKFAKHMYALASQRPDQLNDALNQWYKLRNFDLWSALFIVQDDSKYDDQVNSMIKWNFNHNIKFTPTFYINGRRLPKLYTIDDLSYQIRALADKLEVEK